MSSFAHENCGVAEGSSSAPASTAMTLWQKFANWQNEMEECRRNARNVRQQQEQCMAKIENLRAICKEEHMKIEQFRQMHGTTQSSEAESSLGMLQDLQRRLADAEKEYRIAATSLQKMQQQTVAQTDQRHETMQQILSQSHQFRLDCQELQQQLQTTLPAEEYLSSTVYGFQDNWDTYKDVSSTAHSLRAALHAILAAQSEFFNVTAEDPWISKTLKDLEFFTTAESLEPEKEVDENDPSTWTFIHGNDADFHLVMAAYTRERKVLDATTQELQALQNKQEVLQSKAHDRNQRVSQLQEQLHRLHGDCSRMDAEINRYKHLISEDETLAHTYREKINQRNRRQSSNVVNRRIALNVREKDLLGASRPKPRSFPLPPLVPPIEAGRNEADPIAKTPASFKNPYASTRKHSMEATSNCNVPCNNTSLSFSRDQTQEDLAAVVLGRPSQGLKQQLPDAGHVDAVGVEVLVDESARKNRACNFRSSLQFGCTLEVLNYDSMDNDGDAAAGAVSKSTAEARQYDQAVDDSSDVLEDEDFLNFAAFPSSSRNTPE